MQKMQKNAKKCKTNAKNAKNAKRCKKTQCFCYFLGFPGLAQKSLSGGSGTAFLVCIFFAFFFCIFLPCSLHFFCLLLALPLGPCIFFAFLQACGAWGRGLSGEPPDEPSPVIQAPRRHGQNSTLFVLDGVWQLAIACVVREHDIGSQAGQTDTTRCFEQRVAAQSASRVSSNQVHIVAILVSTVVVQSYGWDGGAPFYGWMLRAGGRERFHQHVIAGLDVTGFLAASSAPAVAAIAIAGPGSGVPCGVLAACQSCCCVQAACSLGHFTEFGIGE